mmetsp:Transcript_24574/g.49281  ORF Transcript_24574/g.49281 Transcript_24574/m.49281 type:complete len:345 (-) Transcript_24574:94-1128(-)
MTDNSLPAPPSIFSRLGLTSGGMGGLKERFKKKKITEYTADQFLPSSGKSATERLRDLDFIHLHTPHEDEVVLLNVTPYRMDVTSMQDVMYLCGGLVGVRFSSDDLATLMKATKSMSLLWEEISELYKIMTPACKKISLKEDESGESPDAEKEIAKKFHTMVDSYVQQFLELQKIMQEKQALVDPDPSARTDAPKLDADPESKQGMKYPAWLTTLLEKHARSKAGSDSAVPASQPIRSGQIRVGEFSLFLSGCVAGLVESTAAESEAMAILVQASNDTVMNVSNADIHAVADHTGHSAHGRCGSPSLFMDVHSRHYWAHRFYNFLSKMTELSAAIKDESTLDHI